jgi:hypothetical protein
LAGATEILIPALPEKTYGVATFDGGGAKVVCGSTNFDPDDKDFELSITMATPEMPVSDKTIFGRDAGEAGDIYFECGTTGERVFYLRSKQITGISCTFGKFASDKTQHVYRFVRVGNKLQVWVDGTMRCDQNCAGYTFGFAYPATIMASDPSATGDQKGVVTKAHGIIDGVKIFDYDFTKTLGKSTTVIPDLSNNGNDGILSVGAGGVESVWAKRVPDENGIIVDANYEIPTHLGGVVHNGCEVGIRQTSPYILPFIYSKRIESDGTLGDYVKAYKVTNHPAGVWKYEDEEYRIEVSHNPPGVWMATMYNKISTDWKNITLPGVLRAPYPGYMEDYCEYDSNWIDLTTGELKTLYWDDFLNNPNMTNDNVLKYDKLGEYKKCHLIKLLNYEPEGIGHLNQYELHHLDVWSEYKSCGLPFPGFVVGDDRRALLDENGEPILL